MNSLLDVKIVNLESGTSPIHLTLGLCNLGAGWISKSASLLQMVLIHSRKHFKTLSSSFA